MVFSKFSQCALGFAAAVFVLGASPVFAQTRPQVPAIDPAWPPLNRECRPWSYWWWHGSAVDRENLSRELQRCRDAGWGGMHIIPIYETKGWENRSIPYLTPEWMAILRHTVEEAARRDMGIDMTLGTGWCYGGPQIGPREASARCVMKNWNVSQGDKIKKKVDPQAIQTLMAFSPSGKSVDLAKRIQPDGSIDWTPPDGIWQIFAISQRPSMKVKRAAPGGEGYMLNPFYDAAVRRYLTRFDDAFNRYHGPLPRALYHDSFEYDANWSPDLFSQFEKRRGYRLQSELPALFAESGQRAARVKSDYRETLSDMMIESSMPLWTEWSRRRGFLTRNQAHGSPANLLDLYALADIPETEMFYRDRRIEVARFASSAAHLADRKLTAAETATWLEEHFTETLADLKRQADDMFLAGVNHLIFHGTCYSPDEAPWPGWVFYASTELNPRNSIWRDVPTLAHYVARCQSVLQTGRPDNDFLLYWPIYDLWHDPAGMQKNCPTRSNQWFFNQPIGRLAERLQNGGYAFDYLSDRQLASARCKNRKIDLPGGPYRALVVPACDHIPLDTMRNLLALAHAGADVIFENRLPRDVPGWNNFRQRQDELQGLLANLHFAKKSENVETASHGQGRILTGNVPAALAECRIPRETMTDRPGLACIRRRVDGGRYYFIANRGDTPFDGRLTLATPAASALVMDPLTDRTGVAPLRTDSQNQPELRLQLPPHASLILRTFSDRPIEGATWHTWRSSGKSQTINGPWNLRFLIGGPVLPKPRVLPQLTPWTEFGDDEALRFAGTALYTIAFDAPPDNASAWFLDLGKVCQSARVRLNGRDLGTLILPPFRVLIDQLKPRDNVLEVEVTNVSANRIRDMDRRKIPWKIFHDANVLTPHYQPLDASNWPLTDSGLLGPVTLTPVGKIPVGNELK